MSAENIESRVARLEEKTKRNGDDIRDLKEITAEIHTMGETLVKLTTEMTQTREDLAEIKADMSDAKNRPRDTVDTIRRAIITAVCSGLVSAIIALIISKP